MFLYKGLLLPCESVSLARVASLLGAVIGFLRAVVIFTTRIHNGMVSNFVPTKSPSVLSSARYRVTRATGEDTAGKIRVDFRTVPLIINKAQDGNGIK